MNRDVLSAAAAAAALVASSVFAATSVDIHAIDAQGVGKQLGTVTAEDSGKGLVLRVQVQGLSAGEHGFHVHQNPDCGPGQKGGKPMAGLAAGDHYDPQKTGRHEGPFRDGHLGDLPAIHAPGGNIETRVIAPRLKASDLEGRSLMIHAGGDNYSDKPEPSGGGGARIACGVVKQ